MSRALRTSAAVIGAMAVIVVSSLPARLAAQGGKPAPRLDLTGFRTAANAITIEIGKASPAASAAAATGYLGIAVESGGPDLVVTEVQATSPAGKAGIRTGDILASIDNRRFDSPAALRDFLQAKGAGAELRVALKREQKPLDVTVTLTAVSRPMTPPAGGTGGGGFKGKGKGQGGPPVELILQPWTAGSYRLGVIVVEFADIKANKNITAKHWDDALFSRLAWTKSNATGQPVFGSLHEYFQEQSFGKFRLEGKVFEPIQVSKKRGDYAQGSGTANKTVPLAEALEKLAARDGKDVLAGFDGLAFIYAGGRVATNRGNLYYPHRGSVLVQGKRVPYLLGPEGGGTMEHIDVFALEFGKLLGLPDLAARTENPGSEGLGAWCLMSDGAGKKGKPAHLSAWCKERLGWLTPAAIDPVTPQKLLLAPAPTSPKECIKVLVRTDGSEYLLLENRAARGFDADLPGQGLLIWRVVNNRPVLEEAHGVAGPTGPCVQLDQVPYPSKANRAFTPFTIPSSRALTGGGQSVHVTNIRRLPDGRIAFLIGYEFN